MQIIQDRRALHRIPELVRQLPRTMEYLKAGLEGLSCQVFSPMESSLCAWFDFGAEEAIAFRADCDALPICEKTGLPFASRHPGKMHACGHDGHMAVLLELARRLSAQKTMPHNVLLVFQPAEEEEGGARELCETGIFAAYGVKAIFALHLWPGLEAGTIASRKEEMLSHACEITVDIAGKPSHIARPYEGRDALAAAALFYTRVQALERSLPKEALRILNFGLFQSGTVRNGISGHTHMEGSLRAYRDEVFNTLYQGLFSIAAEVEQETGCTVAIRTNDGYPAVINPPELFDRVASVMEFAVLPEPFMIAEDFSWYQKHLPGMFFFLGTGDTPRLHSADFDFDEKILVKGADFFAELAEKMP